MSQLETLGMVAIAAAAVLVIVWRLLSRLPKPWRYSLRTVLVVLVAILVLPTVINPYKSINQDVPFWQVNKELERIRLWEKHLGKVRNAQFQPITIFFGTDRLRSDDDYHAPIYQKFIDFINRKPRHPLERIRFGAKLAKKLTIGSATVSIPWESHLRGRVERPTAIGLFDIRIFEAPEDPAKHFVITNITLKRPEELKDAMAKTRAKAQLYTDTALLFVHGYNVTFDAAIYRTAQIAADLQFDGVPLLYSWPSQGAAGSYERDQNVSEQSQPYLKAFIEDVVKRSGAKKIHVIAHSMGNVPLLRVLNEMQLSSAKQKLPLINQVILAAPDIDRDVFENLARAVRPIAQGVTLYASANDKAMLASRVYAGGGPRAGDVPEDGPVVVQGVDTLDVSRLNTDFLTLNHSAFAEKSELLIDLRRIILAGVRPPTKRSNELEEIATDSGIYWKF